MFKFFLIGIGGFVGSVSRYYLQLFFNKIFEISIPIGTLIVNILGSFLIGLLFSILENKNLINNNLNFFLSVGFCGGFTTFSAFTFENFNLIKNGNFISPLIYISTSLIFGILAVYMGISFGNIFKN